MVKEQPQKGKKPRGNLLERMRAANPAGAALLDRHRAQADLALALRSMRKARGMGQTDLRRASEKHGRPLTQSVISALESPTAALPNVDGIVRYAAACGARVELSFIMGHDDSGACRVVLA
ncbi:hypothetical protein D3P06_05015 [Paracoccus aestuarii]|uniref:XRE family transcriptional regulator n=1 Tax=Paracoccus aestuarii TaxID=453842 RepID=A0A418ZZL8_9RHOB|nr:hypothetical protein [Paracoccus aestuarii]RJL06023.1 hypothetical protein D3P06_05015 [Paracoccus aestuarii]WCQ99109.1 hypothetical protein JHW48_14930 [Paracoccus aestuarii]